MKVLLLGVDVTRASCDATVYDGIETTMFNTAGQLDQTAERIAEFTADVRHKCDAVAWTKQDVMTSEDSDPVPLSPEERSFHRVLPFETDHIMSKTQMSPYPEHESYFEDLKDQGIDTVVLMGFDARNCIYWTVDSLLENDFKVIVPEELIGDSNGSHPLYAFEDYMHEVYSGKLVITNAENAADMILKDEVERTPPLPTRTWNDLNSLLFGPGS